MSYTKIWTIKDKKGVGQSVDYVTDKEKCTIKTSESLKNEMAYIGNESKTTGVDAATGVEYQLVTGLNCNYQTATLEFQMREEAYHAKKKENIAKGVDPNHAIHIIQSFSPEESENMTPEQVHELGLEYAQRICGDHFQAVVATHLNTDHSHNHIIINAYALDGIYKFIEDRNALNRIRVLNDELMRERGLEVIIPGKKMKIANYKEWLEREEGTSWKEQIRTDIDSAKKVSKSWYDFKMYLEEAGYAITENKHSVSYKAPGSVYTVCDDRLGDGYERSALLEYWKNQELEIEAAARQEKKSVKFKDIVIDEYDSKGRKRTPIEILLLKTVKKLKLIKKYNLEAKGDIDSPMFGPIDWKIQNMLDTIALARENNIQTQEDLEEKIDNVGMEMNNLKRKLDGDNIAIQNMESVFQDLKTFAILQEEVGNLEVEEGVDIEKLISVETPSPAMIRENRAAMDPMTKNQKMKLFKLMEAETEYKLDWKFSQIDRTEAAQAIAFLSHKTDVKPDIIITAEEFEKKREEARQSGIDRNKQDNIDSKYENVPASAREKMAVASILKKHPDIELRHEVRTKKDAIQILEYFNHNGKYPDAFVTDRDKEIRKLSIEQQEIINSYIEMKERMYGLGLVSEADIAAYRKDIRDKVNTFAEEKEQYNKLCQEYRKFKRMEYNVELAKNPAYTQARTEPGNTQQSEVEVEDNVSNEELERDVEQVEKEEKHDYRNKDKYFHVEL